MSDYSRTNNTPSARDNQSGRERRDIPRNFKNRKLKVISKNGAARLFADPNTDTIEAIAELTTNGYIRQFSNGLQLADKCNEAINGMGFAIVETEELSPGLEGSLKNFTLIGSTNIDETIENSKIIDPDLNKLTPVKKDAADKFRDAADSFYELDQERSESIKNIMKKDKTRGRKARATTNLAERLTKAVRKSPNKILDRTAKRSLKK
tara:strand:- start:432 stop:1055 length:624 start_codon:yes stop_codon:yes gene_type:complete